MARGRIAPIGVMCAVAIACGSTRDADVRPASPPEATRGAEGLTTSDIDLSAVMDRVHWGFRARNDGDLAFDGASHAAIVHRDGSLSFSPRGGPAATFHSVLAGADRARVRALDDGGVEIDRGVAREQLHETAAGLEQEWVFDRPPAARGDVVVRVGVSGYEDVLATATGRHLRSPSGDRWLRYGHATWIDARGTRTDVRSEWDGTSIVLRVPAHVVTTSAFPARLDPIIGPEIALDTAVPAAGGPTQSPVLAPGPNGSFFAAWRDDRPGFGNAVIATRISAAGVPLDKGIVVPLYATTAGDPIDVAYDSVTSRWLVVTAIDGDVRGLRIDANGVIMDANPLLLIDGASTSSFNGASVTFDGAKWLVVGSGYTTGTTASFVDPSGVAGAPIVVRPSVNGTYFARRVVCDATACGLLFGSGNVELVRMTRAGTVLDPNGISLGSAYPITLASDGTQYFVVFNGGIAGAGVAAKRVSSAGAVLDASPLILTTNNTWSSIDVAWNGTSFVVVSNKTNDIFAQRVAPSGSVTDASPLTVIGHSAPQYSPRIAVNGSQPYIAWVDSRFPKSAVYGSKIDGALVAAEPNGTLLTRGSNAQSSTVGASNGSGFLVAWVDDRAGTPAIWAVRLTNAGVPQGAAFEIGKGDVVGGIASNGADYLVLLRDGTSLGAKRVSAATGTVLDAQPIALTSAQPYLLAFAGSSVAWDGQSYVVAWTDDFYDQFTGSDVLAARIAPNGTVLDSPPKTVCNTVAWQFGPSIASDGTNAYVVWSDRRAEYFGADLYGSRIDRNGVVLDPNGVLIAGAGFEQESPSVAWDGTHYVVAFADGRRTAGGDHDIYFTRVTAAGKPVDTVGTLVASVPGHDLVAPRVVSMRDGASNFVSWTDTLDSVTRTRGSFTRIGTGEVLDKPAIELLAGTDNTVASALAPAGSGRALLLYQRFAPVDLAQRAFARFVESGGVAGTTCAQATDCQTRYCRDTVCCSEPCDGACRKCGANGQCVPVLAADDDACAGSCNATGDCRKKNGDVCAIGEECATGFCVDGFCCNTACDGSCDVCNAPRGVCTPVPIGARGTPSCSPKVCNGFDPVCPARCAKDEDCADGFGCDRPSGECVSGSVCSDEHTLRSPNGVKTDCRPYGCNGGACRTSCATVTDCTFPAACDELGRCIEGRDDSSASGCAVARPNERPRSVMWIVFVAATLSFARRRRGPR